jgi:hypothetical protein
MHLLLLLVLLVLLLLLLLPLLELLELLGASRLGSCSAAAGASCPRRRRPWAALALAPAPRT